MNAVPRRGGRGWFLLLLGCLMAGMLSACGSSSQAEGRLSLSLLDANAAAHDRPLTGTLELSRDGVTVLVAASPAEPQRISAGRWRVDVLNSPFLANDPGLNSPNCGPMPTSVVIVPRKTVTLVLYCGDAT